jgi:hypothetical protein
MSFGPLGDDEADLFLERLNYGKLAAADARIPPAQGYGVTRRSLGLDPAHDGALSPPRLMELRRFEPELVDKDAWPRGCLVVRVAPDWPPGEAAPVALLRARFRPESGEHGRDRLYQQSAVWATDFPSFRRWPAAVLALAGEALVASPDPLAEPEAARFASPPLVARVGPPKPRTNVSAASVAVILNVLLGAARTDEGRLVTFAEGSDFTTEAEFLAAVGLALEALPKHYPRWREISVVSGLHNALPGLCLRYLPSYRPARSQAA